MTTDEAKKYLKYYFALKDAITTKEKDVEIRGYRRKESLIVNKELQHFIDLVNKLKSSIKDAEVLKIFECCYEKGLKDKQSLQQLYMAPSTFYRLKDKIAEKLLLLCASNSLLSEEEILNIKIN